MIRIVCCFYISCFFGGLDVLIVCVVVWCVVVCVANVFLVYRVLLVCDCFSKLFVFVVGCLMSMCCLVWFLKFAHVVFVLFVFVCVFYLCVFYHGWLVLCSVNWCFCLFVCWVLDACMYVLMCCCMLLMYGLSCFVCFVWVFQYNVCLFLLDVVFFLCLWVWFVLSGKIGVFFFAFT